MEKGTKKEVNYISQLLSGGQAHEVVQGAGVGAAGPGWGQWVLVLDGVLTAAGSTPGMKGIVARPMKWLGHEK